MVYLILAVAAVVIVQCVTKRKKQAESPQKMLKIFRQWGKHAARMCKRHAKRAAFCRFCIFV